MAVTPPAASPQAHERPRPKWRRLPAGLRWLLSVEPLQWRLFLIVFAGLLPLVLWSSALLIHNARLQKEQQLEAAEDTMRALITAVDYEARESLVALDALAASPRLARDDIVQFRREAREMMVRRPQWNNVVLFGADGQVRMTAVGEGVLIEPVAAARAARRAEPAVGNMHLSAEARLSGFRVRVPIGGADGESVLTAVVQPDAVQALLTSQQVPAGGVAAVFDANHRVVARTMGLGEWLGQPASPQMRRLLQRGASSGWGETRTLEGIPVYSVFVRSPTTGWTAAVGIPVQVVDAPIQRSLAGLVGSVALSALLGFAASSLASRNITRPMRELEASAAQVRAGEPPQMPKTGLPPIRNAAAALGAAYRERERLLQSEKQARLLEQEARRVAETASREKDQLLATLGHEFRNPLAAIASSAELLERGASLAPDAAAQASAIIRRQVKQLAAMTEELLEASRAMAGKLQIDFEATELAAVVDQAVRTLREAGQLHGHELRVSTAPAWVSGDAQRLEQVVSNLLNNALKYTPAGGTIEITTRRVDGTALLAVRDTGAGIERDLLPRVFQPFVQGPRTLDRAGGGLGIGLSLVRRLVELHGGDVEVRSDGPGHGSEFVITLPAVNPDQPRVDAATVDDAASRAARVAVVEDNDDVRASLRRLLELAGHRVIEAADGPAGLDLVVEERPDFAIVDIGLPGMDGYEIAEAVRERLGRSVRLVALTAYGTDEDLERGATAGFDAYLVKPVSGAVLANVIDSLGIREPVGGISP